MNIQRKGRIASWILYVVAITFSGIAAVHFFVGRLGSFNSGMVDAGQAQSAQVAALIGVAFGILALAVSASTRQ